MKVADLQQHLTDLGRLLGAAGAKGAVGDLAALSDGLGPYRDMPLRKFADFLTRAEAYSRGGVPAARPKGPRGGAARGGGKAAAPDLGALTAEVRDLYDQAPSPSVTEARIDDVLGRARTLTKPALVALAEAIELMGMKARSKDEILKAIRQRVLARKGTAQRADLIDRIPSVLSGAGQSPATP